MKKALGIIVFIICLAVGCVCAYYTVALFKYLGANMITLKGIIGVYGGYIALFGFTGFFVGVYIADK